MLRTHHLISLFICCAFFPCHLPILLALGGKLPSLNVHLQQMHILQAAALEAVQQCASVCVPMLCCVGSCHLGTWSGLARG